MYCKHCYKMIEDGSLFCPACGEPQTGKSRNSSKKPIYKRWWFWIIVVVLALSVIGSGSNASDESIPSEAIMQETVSAAEKNEPIETQKATSVPVILSSATLGEQNALKSAKSYLSFSSFSYSGLIDQLEFEGYTTAEATYAANNCGADWNEQALLSAKSYLKLTAFSYTGLIEQLEFEGFTDFEATYGAMNCGANWLEQAARCAESYLEFSSFSRQGLIEQLIFEGFTQQEAEYGVKAVGY